MTRIKCDAENCLYNENDWCVKSEVHLIIKTINDKQILDCENFQYEKKECDEILYITPAIEIIQDENE